MLTVDGQEILVYKLMVAKACGVLARAWDPLWDGSSRPIAIDDSLRCSACSVQPSHAAALLFFEFFYTREVKWAGGQADMDSALQLLVVACMHDVPHLVCVVEMALLGMLNMDNCCSMLSVADHHQASQLRARCIYFIRKGHQLLDKSDGYQQLDPELQSEITKNL